MRSAPRRAARTVVASVAVLWTLGAFGDTYTKPVDTRSYQLGIIGGFAEVVRLGVKTLALSEVLPPDAMDDLLPDAEIVAARNDVQLYRESELLVTDLYPADVAAGLDVLLIYTGDTLEQYLTLKARREDLVRNNRYSGAARRALARDFGRLLSYPDPVIDDLIARNGQQASDSNGTTQD